MSQTQPGWYYADGDPPGTMRYWDGTQWVGEPTAHQPAQQAYSGGGEIVQLDPVGYYKLGWQRWNDFSGRSRRAEYWWFYLGNIITVVVLFVLAAAIADALIFVPAILLLALIVPTLAAGIRRMHDQDKSGWWLLIAFVPFIGGIWQLVLLATDGTRHPNQWGTSPKYG